MRGWVLLSPLLSLLSACDVASVREVPDTIARNQCQSNADCGGNGVCNSEGQCRSPSPTFETVLLEVTPPADGSAIAGVQFQQVKDLSSGDASLELQPIAQVVGKVLTKARTCPTNFVGNLANANDLSVPARVTLIQASSALGLYSPRAVVQADLVRKSYWGFSVNVTPGTYDIYVEPNRQVDESCPIPPLLSRGREIPFGTQSLGIELPQPSVFEFHVTWLLGDGALDGWMVDMLDPTSGRVISNRVPLTLGTGGKTDYVANVSYEPVLFEGNTKAPPDDQLVRLSPPAGLPESAAAPTLFLARSALGLFAVGKGTLTAFSALPSAVHVHGQVTALSTPTPAEATVTLVAQKIAGMDPGLLASFVRTVSVGTDGQFDVYLLPGEYAVSTVPQASLQTSGDDAPPPGSMNPPSLAANTRTWIVPSTPFEQAGKAIGLAGASPIFGEAVDASGDPVATAQVQAVASPLSLKPDVLKEAIGGAPFVPRASAGAVNRDGNFAFKTDPGTFDITVRPNSDTGFAWLVMPNVLVDTEAGVGLGRMTMPLPFAYGGTVTVTGIDGPSVVPGALVRAYIYLKGGDQYTTDSTAADSVLQVAETRADKNGVFELLIPAELNRLQK